MSVISASLHLPPSTSALCVLVRIFMTSRRDVVAECLDFMGLAVPSKIPPTRSAEFFRELDTIGNAFVQTIRCCDRITWCARTPWLKYVFFSLSAIISCNMFC